LEKLVSLEAKDNLSEVYSEDFYEDQKDASLVSGMKYAKLLSTHYLPESVIDIGCGRGSWLKAFKHAGAHRLVGIDGPWIKQVDMPNGSIRFLSADLNIPLDTNRFGHFDLAISVEVAEHLEPDSAEFFVESLTKLSDIVIFGAAFTNQGGTNHLNEQLHSYWAQLFLKRDFQVFDFFREDVWGNKDIPFWYQQNTFLYVHKDSSLIPILKADGYPPIRNLEFMNCVHPDLLNKIHTHAEASRSELFRQLIRKLIPSHFLPLASKVRHTLFNENNESD
jgi:SAM-dependent methyltransferase